MTRGTRLRFVQLAHIVLIWTILGFIIAVYDHLVLHTHTSLGPAESYSFGLSVIRNMAAGLIGALIGGSFLVFYVNVRYQDKPYGFTIAFVSILFVLIVLFITVVMAAAIVPHEIGRPLSDPATWSAIREFMMDSHPLKNGVIWSLVVGVTQLMLQVTSKFGQGVFSAIARGKYHLPKQEKRIFMFLDLNSSTTIAEQLGNERYHQLLRDFFSDITNPILENRGVIYQYVGDEVIVSWEFHTGMDNAMCIRCFFDLRDHIHAERDKYLKRYGMVPTFKAGIHCGDVVAGEVGIIKRDITYSGDVLNTTSRIQGLCREYNQEVIVSADVISNLPVSGMFATQFLGSIKLRGKEQELALNAILLPNRQNWVQ